MIQEVSDGGWRVCPEGALSTAVFQITKGTCWRTSQEHQAPAQRSSILANQAPPKIDPNLLYHCNEREHVKCRPSMPKDKRFNVTSWSATFLRSITVAFHKFEGAKELFTCLLASWKQISPTNPSLVLSTIWITALSKMNFHGLEIFLGLMNVRVLGLIQFPKWSGSGNKSGADGKCTN